MAAVLVAAGLSARDETPLSAVAGVAHRIHWRKHEEQALTMLQGSEDQGKERKVVRRHLDRRQQNKLIGAQMLARYGWHAGPQFPCLERLWDRESGWNHTSGSGAGAYGIPQARPGSKMRAAGADWRTNPATQIKWGLRYIKGRYGSPCTAWAHSLTTGWY